MILAGIDEAGYGPLLGPLVVGCCAVELPANTPSDDLPCLWKLLRRACGKSRDRKGRKLHINDSKLVYSPATGLKELERSVLAIEAARTSLSVNLEAFLSQVAGHVLDDLPAYTWYAPAADERFPLEHDPASIRISANFLRSELDAAHLRLAHLGARVVLERQFNAMLDQTHNKAAALFSVFSRHLDLLLNSFADKGLVIFCDRHGGREHYGNLLRLMFESWHLEIIEEHEGRCEYHLHRGESVVRLLFREKAEAQCLPVAVASMLCKYLRESLMRRFNAYWKTHLPDLAPTAGYYNDGLRFLTDIAAKRQELGIADALLIRSR